MKKLRELRDQHPRAAVAVSAASIFIAGFAAGEVDRNSGMGAPQKPETAIEKLDEMLAVAAMAGPVATKWVTCPTGPGAEALPKDAQVLAWFAYNPGQPEEAIEPMVNIENAIRYRDTAGAVTAWCGTSVGPNENDITHVPPKGTVIVVPNTHPECPDPQPGQQIPCFGQPLELTPPLHSDKRLPLQGPPTFIEA